MSGCLCEVPCVFCGRLCCAAERVGCSLSWNGCSSVFISVLLCNLPALNLWIFFACASRVARGPLVACTECVRCDSMFHMPLGWSLSLFDIGMWFRSTFALSAHSFFGFGPPSLCSACLRVRNVQYRTMRCYILRLTVSVQHRQHRPALSTEHHYCTICREQAGRMCDPHGL